MILNIIFFGSTSDSVIVLEKLRRFSPVFCIVTQPARAVGRKQHLIATPVELWAKKHDIQELTFPSSETKPWLFANEQTVIDTLQLLKADLLVSASYGQKIPTETVSGARFGGLNVHPSLLPRWRGADPVPWAILSGDHQTGVSVVTLASSFDTGNIIAQKKIPILDTDTSNPLRTKLFEMGANLLTRALPDFLSGKNKGRPQLTKGQPYAKRFSREDGFEPWESITHPDEAIRINRKFRALHPWPGLWTTFRGKRLKILGFTTSPTIVQLEGKKPISWEQFKTAYLAS